MSKRLMNVHWPTMDAIAERLEAGEYVKPETPEETLCFQVMHDLDAISGKMHGSAARKKTMRNEIWSLVGRLSAPYWYITLSPADNCHPICIYYAGTNERFDPIPLPYADRARMVCSNPVAAAQIFDHMVKTFL